MTRMVTLTERLFINDACTDLSCYLNAVRMIRESSRRNIHDKTLACLSTVKYERFYYATPTRCSHFTTGCTTGGMNYANEPSQAALERASQDVYGVIASQQGGCVDSGRCGSFDRMNIQNVSTNGCTTGCKVYTHFDCSCSCTCLSLSLPVVLMFLFCLCY